MPKEYVLCVHFLINGIITHFLHIYTFKRVFIFNICEYRLYELFLITSKQLYQYLEAAKLKHRDRIYIYMTFCSFRNEVLALQLSINNDIFFFSSSFLYLTFVTIQKKKFRIHPRYFFALIFRRKTFHI